MNEKNAPFEVRNTFHLMMWPLLNQFRANIWKLVAVVFSTKFSTFFTKEDIQKAGVIRYRKLFLIFHRERRIYEVCTCHILDRNTHTLHFINTNTILSYFFKCLWFTCRILSIKLNFLYVCWGPFQMYFCTFL